MPAQNLTLKDLRRMALAMMGDIPTNSRYGPTVTTAENSLVDLWINAALLDITTSWRGVEDHTHDQAVVGKQFYPAPPDFKVFSRVFYNGNLLAFARVPNINWFNGSNSDCACYTVWGPTAATKKVILGPGPPANPYRIDYWYYRRPHELQNDDDVPEIDNEYREALACFAAARMLTAENADRRVQLLMSAYEQKKRDFRGALSSEETLQVFNVSEPDYGYYGWY